MGIHKHETDTPHVINDAINQTLSRTLVTSFTTLLVVLVLFLFGGEALKGFTFALLVGIGVGTYSSICIATPIVLDFVKKK
jgi:SecD/SecF fusion protein